MASYYYLIASLPELRADGEMPITYSEFLTCCQSNVSDSDYELLKEKVTAEKVKEHFKGIVKGDVVRYELPNIYALNFVMQAALGGGVTRSLSVDMHGKGLSSYLLDMEID